MKYEWNAEWKSSGELIPSSDSNIEWKALQNVRMFKYFPDVFIYFDDIDIDIDDVKSPKYPVALTTPQVSEFNHSMNHEKSPILIYFKFVFDIWTLRICPHSVQIC